MSRSRRSAPPARRPSSPPTGAAHAARIERLVARCREAGMVVTPQRIAIYRALLEANNHPNPEAIYTRVRSTMPSLSLATIYKTLDALAGLGLVSELPATGNSRRYDADQGGPPIDATLHVRFVDVEAATSTVLDLPLGSKTAAPVARDTPADWPLTPIYDTKSIAGTWTGTAALLGTQAVPLRLVLREDGSYESSTPSTRFVGSYGITGGKARYKSTTSGRTGTIELRERDGQRRLIIIIDGGGRAELQPAAN